MAGSILFSVHAPPAIAAELPAAFHVAVSPVDGKINRNIRFLPTQHTTLTGIIPQHLFAFSLQQFFKRQLHRENAPFQKIHRRIRFFFLHRRGSRIFLRRFLNRWQPSRHAPADIPTRPFLCCPL